MKPSLAVTVFAPKASAAATALRNKQIAGLKVQGFKVAQCADLPTLYQNVDGTAAHAASSLVVLAGPVQENCAAAAYLRTAHAMMGIVAMADPACEGDIIRLLQSGVDNHVGYQGSSALLGAMLCRLLSRAGARHPSDAFRGADESWALREQGWVLRSPCGICVPLTTGERAFLMALMGAPDQGATHRQLIDAVNASYDMASPPTHQARLGVMVSRMRSKSTGLGAPIPLKSVHNWGYMFTGPV